MRSMSRLSICRPAVFSLLLWHVTQYLLRVSAAGSGDVPRPAVVTAPCADRALTYCAPARAIPNRANKAGSARERAGRAGIFWAYPRQVCPSCNGPCATIRAMKRFFLSALACTSVAVLAAATVAGQYNMTVNRDRLINAQNEPQNWMMSNGNYASTR